MALNTGSGSKLLAPGLRNVMFQGYKERKGEFESFINIAPSKRAYEEDLEFIGLGVMAPKAEGSPITYADPTQGGVKRYTHVTYAGGYRVTAEMQSDDLYGVAKATRMSKELGKGARVAKELAAANLFNLGFSVADGFPKNGTAQTLFNAAHVLIGGGTYSNTAAADLAQASLEAAIINFHQLVDENGVPIVCIPRQLLVHPLDIMNARQLINSEWLPGSANNNINPTRLDNLTMEVNHYLTDTDAWFLLADKSDHDLTLFDRMPLAFEYQDDFDTGDMKCKGVQRFSVGYGDWRGVYGSAGA